MGSKRRISKKRHRQDLKGHLRKILTPAVWKTLHQAAGDFERKRWRWKLRPLLIVGLVMALDDAPTLRERFGRAREACHALFPKRRRCGRSLEGFLQALSAVSLGGGGRCGALFSGA